MLDISNIGGYIDLETYVTLETVNPDNFLEKNIPILHPSSLEYKQYWKEQRRRCIEGHWVSGTWMPGRLYFYVNFGKIKRNVKKSIVKKYANPLLHDLEWMFFYNWEETRGFSGFEDDPEYSCNYSLNNEFWTDEDLISNFCVVEGDVDKTRYNNVFTSTGERKKFILPRHYLRTFHAGNYGRPLHFNDAKNLMMLGSRGYGKDLHKDSLLWYEDKFAPISEVKIGDKIFNHKGDLVEVTNVFKFIDQLQYKITLADGREVKCGLGHKWKVSKRRKNGTWKESVKTLEEILVDYKIGKRKDSRYYLELIAPVKFPEKDLKVDPYLLGVLLGDGGLTKNRVTFTTADKEMLEYIKLPEGVRINKIPSGKYAYSIVSTTTSKNKLNKNTILNELKSLDLIGKKSEDKFIPTQYKLSSEFQRLELLQGLLDTDGFVSPKGQIEYSSSSKQLAYDVKFLCESLGIRCNLTKRKTKKLDNYRLKILTSKPIFKLKRKLDKLNTNPSKYANTNRERVAIRDIQPTIVEDSYCISVDGEDNLFIVNDAIPTHNSFSVGLGIVLHEWLFDGLTHWIPSSEVDNTVEILVGASDAKYSSDLLSKTSDALDRLPGEYKTYDLTTRKTKTYPSPFYKQHKGSWTVGKQIEAHYKKKVGGKWTSSGTGSNIKHRTFKDNAFAAQGTRPGVLVFEEIGMFPNLLDCYGATVENQRDGGRKFGSMMFLGTGGDFEGGGTVAAYEMFYNPSKYDLLEFEDVWEFKGKIGYFVPAYLGFRDRKDEKGRSDIKASIQVVEQERTKLRSSKGSMKRLEEEIQNRPVKPSEMFLSKSGNFFPLVELKERLAHLESVDSENNLEKKVELFFDQKSVYGVNYNLDLDNKLRAINKFPWNDSNKTGCVVIYEFPITNPDGSVPEGMYIIGHDPVASDSATGESLSSTVVLKTKKYWDKFGHDEIVAVYIGRPYEGRHTVNENLLKLSMLYGNAKVYFENTVGNVKEYFEKMKRLDLLAKQPTTVFAKKASFAGAPSIIYGYPMNNIKFKLDGIQYVRDWLLESRGVENGKEQRNLDRIWDKATLQELISFDLSGNYDRVMSLMGAIVGLNEIHNQYEESVKASRVNQSALDLGLLINNSRHFSLNTPEVIKEIKVSSIDWNKIL